MTLHDIIPLGQRLYALIPAHLRRWTGEPSDPDERDRLANNLLMEMTAVSGAPIAEDDHDGFDQAVIISEALAGFLNHMGLSVCEFR
jgi:hypothetical protein